VFVGDTFGLSAQANSANHILEVLVFAAAALALVDFHWTVIALHLVDVDAIFFLACGVHRGPREPSLVIAEPLEVRGFHILVFEAQLVHLLSGDVGLLRIRFSGY